MHLTPNQRTLVDDYGVQGGSLWSNNILARDTVRLASGQLARRGATTPRPVESSLVRVRGLARTAAYVASGMEIGMGSEGSAGFEPFWVAPTRAVSCDKLDPAGVRRLFGDALFPHATVAIAALTEGTAWWQQVREDTGEDAAILGRWRALLGWFESEPALVETAFVTIGKANEDALAGGSVFPRLLLGRTGDGGIAGLLSVVVHT